MKGCMACTFGGQIPHVPSAVIKNTCLIAYIVLLGYYRIFESLSNPISGILHFTTHSQQLWEKT